MGPCVRRDDVEIAARRMNDFANQTVDAARRALTAQFKTAAIDSAELDARILAGHVLGLDLTGLISAAQHQLTPDESARLAEFARRRLVGEPVARIIGEKEFWGLPLQLSFATLVPRPDTETVVELALELVRAGGNLDRALRIADLGTGSGGLDAYRALIPQAAGLLAPNAALVVEAGEGQSAQIQALMTAAGLMPVIAPKADLAGIPRAVAGHKMAR